MDTATSLMPDMEVSARLEDIPGGTETILAVDDESFILNVTEMCLTHFGYRVLKAESGIRALEIFEGRKDGIDLLMTDIIMPNITGKELAEKVLASKPDMPVLFVSGFSIHGIQRRFGDQDIDYLQKPFTLETLVRKVRCVLDQAGR